MESRKLVQMTLIVKYSQEKKILTKFISHEMKNSLVSRFETNEKAFTKIRAAPLYIMLIYDVIVRLLYVSNK